MSKKVAISIILGVEALVYIFLLVLFPMLKKWMLECSTCGITEVYSAPLLLYLGPGLIGVLMILIIVIPKRKEVKEDG